MPLDWLTAQPFAHRGLHDQAAGVVENTATAFKGAISAGYGIECDLQISADGEAMVHHDDALGRLTEGAGPLATKTSAELKDVRFKNTSDRMLSLPELCDLVAGRAPLLLELKSRFDGDMRLIERSVSVLAHYSGPNAVMSFDPDVIESARCLAPTQPRGIVAEHRYAAAEWSNLSLARRLMLRHLLHLPRTRPHFVAYSVRDLPNPAAAVARHVLRLPFLAWTIRTQNERESARRYADQIIFEKWQP